jgi:hypothetical protein
MKNQLIASAAAVALFAFAGAAQAQTVGHVGANYGHTELDAGSLGDADADAGQLEGAVRFDAGSLGAQIDGAVTRFDGDGGDATVWSATGHLNTKLSNGLIGGFVGATTSDDVTLWAVGAEAQVNLAPSTTLYGQVGYGQSDDLANADFWAGRTELRYFVTDNFKVQGVAGYTKVDADGGDFDIWNVGAEAEYQVAGTPWSVVGGYEHGTIDDLDLDSDTFRIGARYTFGGTLRDRDQSGASLGSAANLFGGSLGQGVIAAVGAVLP